MIRRLTGTVAEKLRNQIILDVSGVGYDVFVTPNVLTTTHIGDEITLHICESIREDAHDLFGFHRSDERAMFEQLRKVSGIGPKAAMSLCAFYSPGELTAILASKDAVKLSLVPGIGKKTAEKIVVELKDKVAQADVAHTDGDLVDALQSLGYTPHEIVGLVSKLPKDLQSTSEKVTWVLRNIGH